jgi:hypothetical protein
MRPFQGDNSISQKTYSLANFLVQGEQLNAPFGFLTKNFDIFKNFGTSVEVTECTIKNKCVCCLQLYKENTSNFSQVKRGRNIGTRLCWWVRTLSGTNFWALLLAIKNSRKTLFTLSGWDGWGMWHTGEQWAMHMKNQKGRDHMEGWAFTRSL